MTAVAYSGFAQIAVRLCQHLDERHGWDQCPSVSFVWNAQQPSASQMPALAVGELPIDRDTWEQAPEPMSIVGALAGLMTEGWGHILTTPPQSATGSSPIAVTYTEIDQVLACHCGTASCEHQPSIDRGDWRSHPDTVRMRVSVLMTRYHEVVIVAQGLDEQPRVVKDVYDNHGHLRVGTAHALSALIRAAQARSWEN